MHTFQNLRRPQTQIPLKSENHLDPDLQTLNIETTPLGTQGLPRVAVWKKRILFENGFWITPDYFGSLLTILDPS